MKRAHAGISALGLVALAFTPLAVTSPAQATGHSTSAVAPTSRPDPAFTPAQRRAAITRAAQQRDVTAD